MGGEVIKIVRIAPESEIGDSQGSQCLNKKSENFEEERRISRGLAFNWFRAAKNRKSNTQLKNRRKKRRPTQIEKENNNYGSNSHPHPREVSFCLKNETRSPGY